MKDFDFIFHKRGVLYLHIYLNVHDTHPPYLYAYDHVPAEPSIFAVRIMVCVYLVCIDSHIRIAS